MPANKQVLMITSEVNFNSTQDNNLKLTSMAEESDAPQLVSAPIIPSLPEIESSKAPFASLHSPSPVILPFGSLMPVVPNGSPRDINVNDQLQGDFKTGPNPGAKSTNTKGGTLQYVQAVGDYMKNDQAVADRYKYGRTYSYGAGYKNANFDRYYTHNKFKELGFSPYRDNDALYNEKGSWWDDFNRMQNQWTGLAWSGFKSIYQDEATSNEEMEKGMAIGSSTRGGFGGWVINFSLNSAYTVGVMSEIILEDLALLGVEALTFGTATPAVGAAGIARNTMAFGKLAKAWSGMHKFMTGLKTVDQVKDFYTAGKAWDRTVDFAKWLNPAQRSMDFVGDLSRGTKGMNNLGNMAKVTKGFGQFYRDFRELNVALSEAFLEGEGASTNYQQQLLDEFYAKNGRMPEGAEADEIYQKGQSIKSTVSLANAATIYYSNKLVFEDLFEGFRPGSKVADMFLEGTGRYLKRAPAKTFKAGTTVAVEAGVKTGLQKTKDFLLKSSYVPWSKKYFVGNLGEALQESSQEVIQLSAMDYYDKISKDPTQANFYSALASIGKGTSDQFSAQGLDTFLQGYLMGSLIQGVGGGIKGIKNKFSGRAAEAKAEGEKTDNNVMNAANHVIDNGLIYGDHNVTMASAVKVANEQKRKSLAEGDDKTANDMTDELQIQYFHTLARTKNMGLVTGHVDDMLNLNDKDLAEAYNLSEDQAGDIRKKLSTLKDRADGYQKKYELAQKRLPNQYNPWMFDPKKNKAAYDDEMAGYMAHENAVANLLFATEDYQRITGRMSSIGKNLAGQGSILQNIVNVIKGGTPVANAAAPDVSLLVDHAQRSMTMQSLKDQISVLNQGTAEQKKEAEALSEQLELLKDWNIMADHYVRELGSEKKARTSPEEAASRQRVARVREGASVVDKKGQAYTVVSTKGDIATVRTKDGQIKRIKRANLEVAKDAKGSKPLEFEEVEGDDLSHAISQLYDTYEKYLRHVAKTKKGYIFDEQLHEAFKQIKDYYALEQDAAGMVHTINALSDPEYFKRYKDIEANLQKLQRERKLAQLAEALKTFEEMKAQNKFLNALFDLGVFVLPEDIEQLKNYEVVDFYNVATKDLVKPNSDLYRKILDLLDEYAGRDKKQVTGKAIPEVRRDPTLDKFNTIARKKLANDKRTYADYAKQFGFDKNSAKSEVPAEEVLKAIATSKYATAAEKTLAKRLLSTAVPGAKITFVNNNPTPGVYKPDTKETVVDARFSSMDYTLGVKGHPIEHVILHEYMHALTVEGLQTDAVFKEAISALNAAAQAYQLSPEGKTKFGAKPLYGTMNDMEFVAEVMSNPTFQAMLQKIPYASTGKVSTLWEEFVDTVRKFFRRLLKVSDTNTALDEAIYIITTKLDTPDKAQPTAQNVAPGLPTTLGPKDLITNSTPVELLKTSAEGVALLEELVAAYKAYRVEQELKPITIGFDMLINTDGFKNFMAESGTAGTIIEAFNAKRKQLAQGPVPIKKVTTPNIWAVGNKKTFTGVDVGGVQHTDIPIEIKAYGEHVDSDTKLLVKEVEAKNLATGQIIILDLNSEEAKDFKYTPLVVEESVKDKVSTDVIPEDVYQRFVDTGEVPMEILVSIGEKIKFRTTLSPYETAIFHDKENAKKIAENIKTTYKEEDHTHKGIPVIVDMNIHAATGEPGAAKYDRTAKVIKINPTLLQQKYVEKAWTVPRKQKDNSEAKALPLDIFSTYDQFVQFVLEHEYQHTQLTHGQFLAANPKSTIGEYEDAINHLALADLGLLPVAELEGGDIMEMYDNITGAVELNEWKKAALEVVSSSSLRDAVTAKTGIDFNSDYVKTLVANKEKDLAMNLTFESLVPGTVVKMKTGEIKVVKMITDQNVILVTPEAYKTNDPTAGTTTIARGAIGAAIKMKHSEFMDKAEKEEPLTADEVTDSNKAVDTAKDLKDPEQMSKEIDESLNKKPEDLDDELGDAINNCEV
jgi:hypothetical protein